ncbi:MAG: hypothetical protein KDC90_17945, partial [Ignavibacteriae bacterium]|nr:hypothetical protein [Ignavibacteriota bacterium]
SHISQRIVDPVGLFFVLIFGLITTAAAVMVTPTDAENTFGSTGSDSLRALSGIGIMLAIATYYLVNTVYRKEKEIINSYIYFAVGYTFFLLTTLLFSRYSIEELDLSIKGQSVTLLLSILFSLPLLTFALLEVKNVYAKLTFAIAEFYSIYLLINNSNNSSLFIIFISGLIATLPLTIVFFYKYEKYISSLWGSSKLLTDKLYAIGGYILMLSLFVFIVGSMYTFAHDADTAKAPVESFFNGVDESISILNNDTRTLLFGFGTSTATSTESTIVSILYGQGLAGLLGYALVFCYSVYLLFKTLTNQNNDYTLKTAFLYFLGFTLLYIPIVGVFTYVTIYGVLLWWINFGLLTSLYAIENNKLIVDLYDFGVTKITIIGKTFTDRQAILIRLLIGLTLLIASFILIYSLLNLRGDLI